MDVEGINPTVVGIQPEWPENFRELSNEEQDAYFKARNKFYNDNPGVYFRANCWSWRPIMEAMWESGACYEIDNESWDRMSFNDGAGAKNQDACNRMAAKLKGWVQEKIWDSEGQWSPEILKTDDMLIDENGTFISKDRAEQENVATKSPYTVNKEHLESWIKFLENCGGFEVW